jgi:hypothetical protein
MKSERSRAGHRQHNETNDSSLMTLHSAHACIHPPPPSLSCSVPYLGFLTIPSIGIIVLTNTDRHDGSSPAWRPEKARRRAWLGGQCALREREGGTSVLCTSCLSAFDALSDKRLPPAGPHKTPPPEILCPGIESQAAKGVGEEQALIPAPGKAPDPAGQAPDPGAPGADPEEKALNPREMA